MFPDDKQREELFAAMRNDTAANVREGRAGSDELLTFPKMEAWFANWNALVLDNTASID